MLCTVYTCTVYTLLSFFNGHSQCNDALNVADEQTSFDIAPFNGLLSLVFDCGLKSI